MDEKALRSKFEEAIEQTRAQIMRYEELTKPVAPDNAIGRVSRMDAINNKSVVEAALLKARAKLRGLISHLEKLGSTTFGNCPNCKKEIPVERILLAPESAFCVNCAR